MMRALACVVALGIVAPRPALADDSKDTGDTLASPWSGGALRLSEQDKRFLLAVSTLFAPGVRVRTEISAPLDDATRTAVFLDRTGVAPAFRAALFIGYDSTWQALAQTKTVSLTDLCGRPDGCTASQLELARRAAEKASDQRKRDGQPLSGGLFSWNVGLDLAFAYDRETAFLDDVGNSNRTKDFSSNDLQLGASGLVHLPQNWAFTFRIGYERTHTVELGTFRRCTTLPSTDPMVSGQDCSDQKYLRRDLGVASSGYVRISAAYYPSGDLLAHYVSATELRLNAEELATDAASFDVHLLIFAKGIEIGSSSVRTGIGTTVRTALRSPAGADYGRGDIYAYSVFGIVGTSF